MKKLSPPEIILIVLTIILVLSIIFFIIYMEISTKRLIKKLDEDTKRILEKWKNKDNGKRDI